MGADVPRPVVVLGPGSSQLRRALGPMPWVSLEALAARSRVIDGRLVADVSVRSLASELGVAKDTAARALGALRDAGLIVAAQGRGSRGRFAGGCYAVVLPPGALAAEHARASLEPRSRSTAESLTNAAPQVRRPDAATAAVQLSLLETD
jgi:DNA-binding transcriptional MocR family regulator